MVYWLPAHEEKRSKELGRVKSFTTTTCVMMALLAFFTTRLGAQSAGRTLTAATLCVAVDDWGDFYLNGMPIVEQPYTSSDKSFQIIKCLPEHLCYFQRDNILAIQVEKSGKQMARGQDSVGIAYLLRMEFSDGTQTYISSNEAEQHACLYLPNRMMARPANWMEMSFNGYQWRKPISTGFNIPMVTPLNDPTSGQAVGFLSASSPSPKAQYPGERHLFRRKFFPQHRSQS